MRLGEYRSKRRGGDGRRIVVQHHAARSDHYDFRLEIDGVLVSWAIPKGPSTNPKDKRMARRTEDHPLDYAAFEGVIPQGEYGAGGVIVRDHGSYDNVTNHEMAECLERGHLSLRLHGQRLGGGYARSQPQSVLSGRTLDDLS